MPVFLPLKYPVIRLVNAASILELLRHAVWSILVARIAKTFGNWQLTNGTSNPPATSTSTAKLVR